MAFRWRRNWVCGCITRACCTAGFYRGGSGEGESSGFEVGLWLVLRVGSDGRSRCVWARGGAMFTLVGITRRGCEQSGDDWPAIRLC